MSLRKKQYLIIAVIGVGLLLAIIQQGQFLGGAGIFLIVVGLVMDVLLLRCPKCGTWLGKYLGEYCSNGGAKIDGKKESDGYRLFKKLNKQIEV